MIDLNRRALLQGGASLALLALVSRAPLIARPLGANPFTLGVASGDPWPDGFVIWTRLAPRPLDEHGGMPAVRVPVRWEVAEDHRFAKVVRHGEAMAVPELGHSVHVEIEGLRPHRHYFYRFSVAGSELSPVGRVRTTPMHHEQVDRVRIGIGGCQHYEQGFFDAWQHMAQEPDLDLVFHYGDYIYEYGATALGPRPGKWTAVRQHVGDEIYSIDDYRRRYAQYKSDAHLQAAHAACAFATTFDDHEIDNNFAGDIDQDGSTPEVFALRRMGGLQAWYENMPVRRSAFPSLAHGLTAYRRLQWGRLLRTHVLDTRSYRSDQPCHDGKRGPCNWEAHNAPQMLGSAQESWLERGLATPSQWNLLAQQVIAMPVDFRQAGASEPAYATDLWDGYRPARQRLVEMIQRHSPGNVIIASGDHHRHLVGELPENDQAPDGNKVAVEFTAASITSNGNGVGAAPLQHIVDNNPHFALYTDQRGYQVFDITPTRWTTEVKVMDYVDRPGSPIHTLQRFAVQHGRPQLLRL